jgi:uncharacterized protein YaiI (UPF0178 family)
VKILLDADSCPKAARSLVLRRVVKLKIRLIFAANRSVSSDKNVEMEICSKGENSADDRIVELAEKGDIVVTRDVPLAKRLVDNDISVLDDRGRVFTKDNIKEILSLRNFTVGLAENGLNFQRTANYGRKDLKTFADSLDRMLAQARL